MDIKEEDRLNRMDYGFYGSTGLRFHLKSQQIFVAVHHYRGMVDADKNNKSLNRDLGFKLGWMIGL
jgi:hypothetical protein